MVDATVKTAVLLEQVLAGDEVALDRLLQRHLPLLQRLGHAAASTMGAKWD